MPRGIYVRTAEHRKLQSDLQKGISCPSRASNRIEGMPTHIKTIHQRMWQMYGKADHCENPSCSGISKRFNWSNKRHDYKSFDREDWQQLCTSCHESYDILHNGRGYRNSGLVTQQA